MSKYNHIKSIPIKDIPKEEMAQAIKEWAEGDEALERLLWAFYNKGIETSGCHAGRGSYVDVNYQEDIQKIICLLKEVPTIPESQILICIDGGNPFSGPEWDVPSITFGFDKKYKDETDICFDKMTETLEKDQETEKTHPLIELLDFFLNKESTLMIRLRNTKEKKYRFQLESSLISNERYIYYNGIFEKAGLTEIIREESIDKRRHTWRIETDSLEALQDKINIAIDYIIHHYSLDAETSEEEIISFNTLARLKKKTLSENDFNTWLDEEYKKR